MHARIYIVSSHPQGQVRSYLSHRLPFCLTLVLVPPLQSRSLTSDGQLLEPKTKRGRTRAVPAPSATAAPLARSVGTARFYASSRARSGTSGVEGRSLSKLHAVRGAGPCTYRIDSPQPLLWGDMPLHQPFLGKNGTDIPGAKRVAKSRRKIVVPSSRRTHLPKKCRVSEFPSASFTWNSPTYSWPFACGTSSPLVSFF